MGKKSLWETAKSLSLFGKAPTAAAPAATEKITDTRDSKSTDRRHHQGDAGPRNGKMKLGHVADMGGTDGAKNVFQNRCCY